jgi:STE24 endopeptidase
MDWLLWLVAAAIVTRLTAQLALARLNAAEVERHRAEIPAVFRAIMDGSAYRKSVEYTLAKNRFGLVEDGFDAALLAFVIFSGVLPAAWGWWTNSVTGSLAPWSAALFLIAIAQALALPALPFEWWAQFRLEAKFGFNQSTLRLWLIDKLKGLVLGVAIGFPLLWIVLQLVEWIGPWWWLCAWAVFFGFQLLMIVVYPRWILPWFNKLTPLPEGELRSRLLALAERSKFPAADIFVMDGSKRSRHSNAFFSGIGRFRRIVLFDTLIAQLDAAELEAVLAHEIGHYKLGHVPRMLAVIAGMTLGAFWLVGWVANAPAVLGAFGFGVPHVAPALLLLTLLGGVFTFWFAPLGNLVSRRHEYQADAFARRVIGAAEPMMAALRKLTRENLSNLTPHRLFSAFYYSHPTLAEREAALQKAG